MKPATKPIGIFDSGLGGLTVMRAVRQLLPFENIVYFGDTARLPYGSKSPEMIIRYCLESGFFLKNLDVKTIVIACHTASCIALQTLQQQIDLPVIGLITSSIEQALLLSKNKRIGVIGTAATIHSKTYETLLKNQMPEAQVFSVACPLFVPIIEEGLIHDPIAKGVIRSSLAPLTKANIDVLLMACTHYPLLSHLIQKELGPHVCLIDPSQDCAKLLQLQLQQKDLLNENKEKPYYRFFVSDNPDKFQKYGAIYLDHPIESVCQKF